ncbi:MAG: YqgE/AlgH family protein [Burkholderiales bacterium]
MRLAFAAVLVTLCWTGPARAADLDAPMILVAKPRLRDELYGATILLAKPVGNDRHVGFIINRPTAMTLGRLFPEHGPSQKVPDPIYLGGPFSSQFIFALVQRSDSPGGRSLQMTPELYVAMDAETVDRIIEADAAHARFFAGLVAWQQGELRDELKRGMWYALEPEAELVMRKQTEGLWEELVNRSERRANGI